MNLSAARWRDTVPPVPADAGPRPRWSVMVPTYRCARFLTTTLESVLAQDFGPAQMQIEVVDDASDDDPESVVSSVGRGRVGFVRQPRNVGHVANFQTCLVRSRGEIVHVLHGDDFVRPGFYAALQVGFDTIPKLGAAFCRSVYATEDGTEVGTTPEEAPEAGPLEDALVRLAREQRVMTPAIAVRRAVYETLGGFDRRLACAEDWEMWVRIAASFPIWYEPRRLAVYRMHADSNTGRHVRSAADAAYNRAAIKIFASYLPRDGAAAIVRDTRRTYAASALETARGLMQRGDYAGFGAQVREALLLSPSPAVIRQALAIVLKRRRSRDLRS
jgi:glycosyltransferase involved in cell wall biosynthesis